jgi:hypothetical protein
MKNKEEEETRRTAPYIMERGSLTREEQRGFLVPLIFHLKTLIYEDSTVQTQI